MIRLVVYALLALIALLLQTTLLPAFLPSSVKPDLLLLLLIYFCLVEDFFRGGLLAWSLGCLLDCLGGHYLGLQALVFLLVFVVGRNAVPNLNGESPLLLLFLTGCASLLQPFLLFVFGGFADIGRMWPLLLERSIFQAMVNVVTAFFCLRLVAWLQRTHARWLAIPGFEHLRNQNGS